MTKSPAVSTEVKETRLTLFGPPPLLPGEDTAAYDELLARVSGAVKPADVLEEIWVRDVVDLVWETFRLRRLKANLLDANAHRGLERILVTFLGWDDAKSLAASWAQRDRSAIKQVDKLLASAGLTMDAVMAQTLSADSDEVGHAFQSEAGRCSELMPAKHSDAKPATWHVARAGRLV